MPVNIDTFFMADWFEAKLVKPANSSTNRDCAWKMRKKVVVWKEMVVDIIAKNGLRHVRLTLLKSVFSNSQVCLTSKLFIRENTLSLIFALLCIIEFHIIFKEFLGICSLMISCKYKIISKETAGI